MTAPVWSLNRQAAKAVVINARNVDDARLLLDVLGLVDGPEGREVLPDDRRGLDLELLRACPGEPPEDDAAARARRRPRNTTPAGLLNAAAPVPAKPALMRRTTPSPRPAIVEESTVPAPAPATSSPPVSTAPTSRQRPINHGTNSGYEAHRKRKEPIADGDPCGCLAAHRAYVANWAAAKKQAAGAATETPTEKGAPPASQEVPSAAAAASAAPGTAPEPASGHGYAGPDAQPQVSPSRSRTGVDGGPGASDAPAEPPVAPTAPARPTPEEIRARVDGVHSRVNEDDSINASHVAMEQTLRSTYGHPSYIAELDGPGKFRPTSPAPAIPGPATMPRQRSNPQLPAIHHGTIQGWLEHHDRGALPACADCAAAAEGASAPAIEASASVAIPRDLAKWLSEASSSPSRAVRRSASAVAHLLEQLLAALDELARAERSA